MSTNTSLPKVEEFDFEEESNVLLLDDKEILAQTVSLRNAFQEIPWYEARKISGCVLYGILRSRPVESINVTVTDPVYVLANYFNEEKALYCLDWRDYVNFLSEFCRNKTERVDWLAEGF